MTADELAAAVASRRAVAEDWQRLGKAIADRRFERDLSQESLVKLGGPSHQTVRNVERGLAADYRPATFRKFDRALGWRDGTTEKILAGAATEQDISAVVAPVPALAWAALGDAVRHRREAMRLPVDLSSRGGPTEMTVRSIEAARASSIRPQTKNRLEVALSVREGWVDRVLDGTATPEDLDPAARFGRYASGSGEAQDERATRIGRLVLALAAELGQATS